jgi:predicted  nucleic acid-binding Zn-ribbon protein
MAKLKWWARLWRRRPRLTRVQRKIPDRTQAKLDNLNHRMDHLERTTQKLSKRLDDIDWRLAGLETNSLKKRN